MKNKFILLGFSFLFISHVNAQHSELVENIVQKIALKFDTGVDYEQLYDQLQFFIENPIDLNKAQESSLKELGILSTTQIHEILNYRERNRFLSVYELQSIPSLDIGTLEALMPMVTVNPLSKANQIPNAGWFKNIPTHYLILRYDRVLQKKNGFKPDTTRNKFMGSPGRLMVRYRLNQPGKFSIGLNMEKDQGEGFIWSPKNNSWGADHLNFHLMLKDISGFEQLILGDYKLQFGQGLVLGGAGFNLGKGVETILGIKRNDVGFKPHNSMTEYGYFRGLALTKNVKRILSTLFISHKTRDMGKIEKNGNTYITMRNTGMHRTQSELEGRYGLKETVFGFNMDYILSDHLKIGLNSVLTHYSEKIHRQPRVYNVVYFKGNRVATSGFHFDFTRQNMNMFGELAFNSMNQAAAWNMGTMINLSDAAELSIHWRNYPMDFISMYGNAFSEKTGQQNEKGIFIGFKCKIFRSQRLSVYFDQFQFPWLRSTISRPSSGHEIGINWNYKYHKKSEVNFRYEFKETDSDSDRLLKISMQETIVQHNFKWFLQQKTSDHLTFRTRIHWTVVKSPGSIYTGFLIAEDLLVDLTPNLRFSGRISLFDTQDFSTRQYIYENDVLYSFSIPSFSGTGIRYYLLIKYRPFNNLTFWIKYGITRYRDRDKVGTGLDEINGNRKSELKIELKYSLR